jgi:hypothetical protein
VSEHEFDPFIDEIAGELKRPVRFDSSFESRVMSAIDPSIVSSGKGRKPVPWLLRPRTFYVSPLAGIAVAAGLVAMITMSALQTAPNAKVASGSPADTPFVLPERALGTNVANVTPTVPVMYAAPFTYVNRNAKSVSIVGSFNDWDSTRNVLAQTSDSVWSTNIMLAPGRYEYQLMVDGKLIPDPSAQRTAESEFGAANSVVIVGAVPR